MAGCGVWSATMTMQKKRTILLAQQRRRCNPNVFIGWPTGFKIVEMRIGNELDEFCGEFSVSIEQRSLAFNTLLLSLLACFGSEDVHERFLRFIYSTLVSS